MSGRAEIPRKPTPISLRKARFVLEDERRKSRKFEASKKTKLFKFPGLKQLAAVGVSLPLFIAQQTCQIPLPLLGNGELASQKAEGETGLTSTVSKICLTCKTLVMCHVYLEKVPSGKASLRTKAGNKKLIGEV